MAELTSWHYQETLRRCQHFILTEYTIRCNVEELVAFMSSKGHVAYQLYQRINETPITWDKMKLLLNSLTVQTSDIDLKTAFDDLVSQLSSDRCVLYIAEKLTETLEEVSKLTPEKPKDVIEEVKRIHEGITRVSIFEIQQCLGKILTDYDTWFTEMRNKKDEGGPHVPSGEVEDTESDSSDTNTALMIAAQENDCTRLEEILSQTPHPDVNAVNGNGRSALSLACSKASTGFVQRLLKTDDIDVNLPDKSGTTPLMYSMARCDIDVIDSLLKCDSLDLDATDDNGLDYMWYILPNDVMNDLVATIQVPSNQMELEECLADFIRDTKHKHATINWQKRADLVTFLLTSTQINNIELLKTVLLLGNETLVSLVLRSNKVEIEKDDVEDIILNAITGKNPEVIKMVCDSSKIPFQDIDDYSVKVILKHACHHDDSTIKHLMVRVTSGPYITKALKMAMTLNSNAIDNISVLLEHIDSALNITDKYGNDVFMILCKYGKIELLKELLKHPKLNLATKNYQQQTAYMISFKNMSKDLPNLILNHALATMDVNGKDQNGITNLMCAAKFGNYECVKTLLSHPDIDTSLRDMRERNALHYACRSGVTEMYLILDHAWMVTKTETEKMNYTRIVQLLTQCKTIDKDITDDDGNNPLMLASLAGNLEVVSTLLDSGVSDINATNRRGLTACHIACLRGTESIVTKLFETGKINMNTTGQNTMLGWACTGGNEAIVSKLVEMGAEVNETDSEGCTGLIRACQRGRDRVVDVLLGTSNIDVHIKDNTGCTAIVHACKNGRPKLVTKLIEHSPGNYVNEADSDGLFMVACEGGIDGVVKICLDKGVDVNGRDGDGMTGLMWACKQGREKIVDRLLRVSTIDVNVQGESGETALMNACEEENEKIVEMLLGVGTIDVNMQDKRGWTALITACFWGNDKIVERLLGVGTIDVNVQGESGEPALIWACEEENEKIVERLLGVGTIDVNVQDTLGQTALIRACIRGKERIVERLLGVGAIDVNVQDTSGETALIKACEEENEKIVEMLLGVGAIDVNVQDTSGETALIKACEKENEKIVERLLGVSTIDVNVQNKSGETALITACYWGREKIVERLIRVSTIDVNMPDKWGHTALIKACRWGKEKIVEMLLRVSTIDVNVQDESGWTVLIWACVRDNEKIVERLLGVGAIDVNVQDKSGETALIQACRMGREKIVDRLLGVSTIDVNVQDTSGETALIKACEEENEKIVERLLGVGTIDVNVQNESGETALIKACKWGREKIVERLLGVSTIDVNVQDTSGETALITACEEGNEKIVEMLLGARNINIHIKDSDGWNALSYSREMHHDRITSVLKAAGAIDASNRWKTFKKKMQFWKK